MQFFYYREIQLFLLHMAGNHRHVEPEVWVDGGLRTRVCVRAPATEANH